MMDAPFPYFGGKATVADVVWRALGDCGHYIEPFCGSCAVLLKRPTWHTINSETVNDADGHIANVWRALKAAPEDVAEWCDWPVNHADLIARKKQLNLHTETLLERLCTDDGYYDAKLAGYYIWSASCWIGSGLVCPNQRPHLGDKGEGVHKASVRGQRPHLGGKGQGVHKASVRGKRPHLTDKGQGVHKASVRDGLYDWFRALTQRLRYVRVVCGDWSRVCGGDWQDVNWPTVGMFFDPPYSDKADRDMRCYAVDSIDVAHAVRDWCLQRGDRPSYRIVLAGYYDEHAEELLAAGWTVHRWSTKGGYGNTARNGETQGQRNRHEEALFMSPYCHAIDRQLTLFGSTSDGL